jgi:tRNA dimethylallyltransferase
MSETAAGFNHPRAAGRRRRMRIATRHLPRDRPVLIAGPTASGKSALALEIAAAQGRAVVNADALQVWSCWRVLTARPSPADEAAAPHHLYGHLARGAPWSVGHWLRAVAPLLPAAPVVVGGTGLYLSALTEGLAEVPPVPPEVRAAADALLAGPGLGAMLAELDAATRARIDPRNPARVRRAWEVLAATGRGLADWQAAGAPPLLPVAAATAILLEADRDRLAARIDARFAAMLAAGALDEVRANLPLWAPRAPWAQAIGARELVAHLRGGMALAEATARAQAATRQYAKRQRSWFRARMRNWQAIAAG